MLPKKKTSKTRTRTRRAHQAMKPVAYVECPECHQAKLPHAACDSCGYIRPGLSLELKKEE